VAVGGLVQHRVFAQSLLRSDWLLPFDAAHVFSLLIRYLLLGYLKFI
jgi:hypothetical protein